MIDIKRMFVGAILTVGVLYITILLTPLIGGWIGNASSSLFEVVLGKEWFVTDGRSREAHVVGISIITFLFMLFFVGAGAFNLYVKTFPETKG